MKKILETIKSSLCDFIAEGGYEIICGVLSTIMIILLSTVYIPFSLLVLASLFILIEGHVIEGCSPLSNFQNYKGTLTSIYLILLVTSVFSWNFLDSFPPLNHKFNFELNIEFNIISYILFMVSYTVLWVRDKK